MRQICHNFTRGNNRCSCAATVYSLHCAYKAKCVCFFFALFCVAAVPVLLIFRLCICICYPYHMGQREKKRVLLLYNKWIRWLLIQKIGLYAFCVCPFFFYSICFFCFVCFKSVHFFYFTGSNRLVFVLVCGCPCLISHFQI